MTFCRLCHRIRRPLVGAPRLQSHILLCVLLYYVCAFLCAGQAYALELAQCKNALGMESGEIKNEDISASSSFDGGSVGPQNARIRNELSGGAWCPKDPITRGSREFLEINLRTTRVITVTETQGRFGNGQGLEYAEQYAIEYWRPQGHKWIRYKNRTGEELFQGNTNTYTEVKQEVNPPIIASKIRFIPHSAHTRTVCMRVELYGCPWRDGLISYSMPQGERRGSEIDLFDMTYDGVEEENFLRGGLGQLTDGQKGQDNFRLDANGFGKGYEWVGWKNDTAGHMRPIEITFEFDQVRNFSTAYFYTNNLFSKDVQVFSGAKIQFSIGGQYYNGEPLYFSYMPDTVMEQARNVTIRLQNRIGKFVKFQLNFASKWMMISEVSFESVVAVGNFTEETEPIPYVPSQKDPNAANYPPGLRDDQVSTAVNDKALSNQYIGLIIGVLAAVILLLVLIIFVIIVRNRRRKQNNNHTVLKPVEKRVTINMKVDNQTVLSVLLNPSATAFSVCHSDDASDDLVQDMHAYHAVSFPRRSPMTSPRVHSRPVEPPPLPPTTRSSSSASNPFDSFSPILYTNVTTDRRISIPYYDTLNIVDVEKGKARKLQSRSECL